jgi:hypothetical protein
MLATSTDFLSDVNNYVWFSLLNKKHKKAYQFASWFNKDFRNFFYYSESDFVFAGNLAHAAFLSKNDASYYEKAPRIIEENTSKAAVYMQKWFKMMYDDYTEFEKLGIKPNADSLKLALKAQCYGLNVSLSPNLTNNTKHLIEKKLSISRFVSRVKYDFSIGDEGKDSYSRVHNLGNNLYEFKYLDGYAANGEPNFMNIYFYLNKNIDVFIVNSSKYNLSEKKKAKVIEEAKLIKDKDFANN